VITELLLVDVPQASITGRVVLELNGPIVLECKVLPHVTVVTEMVNISSLGTKPPKDPSAPVIAPEPIVLPAEFLIVTIAPSLGTPLHSTTPDISIALND
jgi:hypothetical protein